MDVSKSNVLPSSNFVFVNLLEAFVLGAVSYFVITIGDDIFLYMGSETCCLYDAAFAKVFRI